MKKMFLSVLLLPVLAFAQEPVTVDKPVVCNWTRIILENLTKNFREEPIWVGQSVNETRYSVFTDKKGNWTIVQFDKEIACIIGAGEKGQLIFNGPKI